MRVLILTMGDDSQVKASQEMLFALGYDVGEVDGFFGRQTSRAARAFQADQGLKPTATLDPNTVAALYRASGAKPPSGHLFVRQGFVDLFDTPIEIEAPKDRIGTHLFTAMGFEPTTTPGDSVELRWTVVTVDDAEGVAGSDPASALDRLTIPAAAREKIETLMRPGSTIIVSDAGYGWETGQGTDFIVQPK